MKRLIEFPLEDGDTILVEVEEPEELEGVFVPAAAPGEVLTKAEQTFETALEKVKAIAGTVISKLRGLHDAPDEVEVEFGLKMSANAGVIVASAGVEANYKVTLTWKREKKEESGW